MKMSDALRGAAETAPIDDVRVETATAASRVRRHRAVRVGANGIVGVGAAALVVAGVVGAVAQQTGVVAAEGDATRDMGGETSDGGAMEPGFAPDTMLACGYKFDLSAYPTGAVTAVATLGEPADGGLPLDVAYSTTSDGAFTVDVPGVYVLWDGIVVANPGVAADGALTTVTSVEPGTISGTADLVNCWDGSALPAGDYTVITVTSVMDAVDVEPVEEPTGPAVEPEPIDPSTEPVDPDTSVSSDAAGAADIAVEVPTYAVSDAVALTIAGDAVENPFDQYLNPEQPVAPELPSDALTADAARAAYQAALAGAWDMAPGTQRIVKTGDAQDLSQDQWTKTYFGCAMDGVGGSFPASSADLTWLGVDANLPSNLSVSYGWIVDGNPLVGFSVKNETEWSLPGFYPGTSPHLYLVKDGKVVAEAYPVNPDNNSGGVVAYAAEDSVEGEDAKLIWAPENEYLAPGEVRAGDYLWRDVSGCWNGNGQTDVSPGTYTVLASHEMYIGGSFAILEGDPAATTRDSVPSAGGGDSGSTGDAAIDPAIDPAIAPAPDQSDYVSFQVWTSLGTITVSN
jgi:hypothetical protein